jgi:uncharacterized membrane protein YfcA
MLDWYEFIFIGLAALAGGFINAIAGGGTLITFPMLTAVGLPAVVANITNTVALSPGYLGATIAQWNDLKSQKKRMLLFIPASIIGGIIGGILLLNTGEKLFRSLVPFLILLASALLAVGDPLRNYINRRLSSRGASLEHIQYAILPVTLAAMYGGYFGAGLSVIVLAVLGFLINDSLTRLNALKQSISFSVNIAAAFFFVFSGQVNWWAAMVMAVFAIIGGSLGGRLAGKIKPSTLRWTVVTIGVVVAIIYFIR